MRIGPDPTIEFVAKRSFGVGNGRDPDVAEALAGFAAAQEARAIASECAASALSGLLVQSG